MGERRSPGRAGRGAALKRAPRSSAAGLKALLRRSGFAPRALDEAGPPFGFALGPLVAGGFEAVAFAEEDGLTLGLKLPLPSGCEMAGLAPTAERALKMLGAMTLGLQSHGLQVTPVARYRGVEALLLSRHVCGPLPEAAALRAAFDGLGRTAHLLARALVEPEERILVALRHAAGVHGLLAAAPGRREAARVPSFDEETARKPSRARARR